MLSITTRLTNISTLTQHFFRHFLLLQHVQPLINERRELALSHCYLLHLCHIFDLKKIYSKGDGNLLNLVTKILANENIKVISSHKYSKNLILNNTPTFTKPSKIDISDFRKGKKILNLLSKFDNAQGIIIDGGYILAVEAAEGTDEIIKRKKNINYKKNNLVSGSLIKITKKKSKLKI